MVRLLPVLALVYTFFPSVALAQGLFESTPSRVEQRAVVNGDVCDTTSITVAGLNIANGVCICLEGGAVTPASLLTIRQQISANSGVLSGVITAAGGVANLAVTVGQTLVPGLLNSPKSCVYPDHAVPNTCSSCGYACYTDATTTYVPCGTDYCILQGASCVSGMPGRRRSLSGGMGDFQCPKNSQACPIPGVKASKGIRAFECINTNEDLESCGGCSEPLSGYPAGQDCTAIPHVTGVSCRLGKCIVQGCEAGFALNGTACVPSSDSVTQQHILSDYWSVIENTYKSIPRK